MTHALLPASARDRLVLALDVDAPMEVETWLDRLQDSVRWLKIGPRLFTGSGPALIDALVARDFRVFLDLKFHDIPEVVAGAVREAVRRGVSMLTMHTSGGLRMMQAAVEAARDEASRRNTPPPILLGVTVLTSLTSEDLLELGFQHGAEESVDRLARLAHRAGLDGVVCSPLEVSRVKGLEGGALVVLTPGIRPSASVAFAPGREEGSSHAPDDQRRIATPAQAVRSGADFLVVGRPILRAADPEEAIAQVLREIEQA